MLFDTKYIYIYIHVTKIFVYPQYNHTWDTSKFTKKNDVTEPFGDFRIDPFVAQISRVLVAFLLRFATMISSSFNCIERRTQVDLRDREFRYSQNRTHAQIYDGRWICAEKIFW